MTGTALDRMPPPPSAKLLGWRFIEARPQDGWLRIGFEGRQEFANPAGSIQGGIQTAMLDETMGPAVWVKSDGRLYTVTIDINVTFLAPALPGPLFCEGTVIQLGKTVGFLEGRLMDAEGRLLARATSTCRLVPVEKLAWL